MDFNVTANILAKSAGRALGSVINKYFKLNGLGYGTFTKLFHACIAPVMDYGSEIWGLNEYPKIDTVQNRAIRVFLGVHGFAANAAITGDMGWTSSRVRRRGAMVRYWKRLVDMSDDRLTKQVFLWDYQLCRNNWSSGMKNLFHEIEEDDIFTGRSLFSKERAWAELHDVHCRNWTRLLHNTPKLRTYRLYKEAYSIEHYVSCIMSRKLRSGLARFRSGTLLLEIETGRWRGIPEEQRICKMCNTQSVESESHFLLHCPTFDTQRREYFDHVQSKTNNLFGNLNDAEKLKVLMEPEFVAGTASLVVRMYDNRKDILYHST
jgi:hypothetical protein